MTLYRPKTLTEAIELSIQPDSIPLAGGALTLPDLALTQSTIVDIQDVEELRLIDQGAGGATFGAAIPLQTVLDWPSLPHALRRALTRTIPSDLRTRLSLGECLRFWQTPLLREWITVLMAHDIGIEVVNADYVRVWDNIVDLIDNGRLDQQFVTAINIAALSEGEAVGAAYAASTPDTLPLVNAAAFIYLDPYGRVESEYIYVSGASAQPITRIRLDTLTTYPLDSAHIDAAVQAVPAQVDPVDDERASAEDRRKLALEVVQRALTDCMEQLA
ncbi:MAG TPA: FAD binding domain-containing protein [Phototrophicaceae bacterium]|nr:FAD binding domain-containing protein [Phototrophicaceae bacterium]